MKNDKPNPPKSTDPIGAYVTHKGTDKETGEPIRGFAAYDATGHAWPVDQITAERIGIKRAAA